MRRPARKKVPLSSVRIATRNQNGLCFCGCGEPVANTLITIDHEPALSMRDINDDGTDYRPPQADPGYLRIYLRGHDKNKTFGSGGTRRITTRDGDIGRNAHNKSMKQKHDAHRAIMRAKHGVEQ